MTPETRFAPARLCASRTLSPTISATIAAVVVFPFVAETIAAAQREPGGQFADRAGIDSGEDLPRECVVPPPRPATRESRPAVRASAISARRRTEASLRAASSHSNE